MPSVALDKAEFARRVRQRFYDPAFKSVEAEIERIIDVAWDGYHSYRKSPRTKPAGPRYADPKYDLSIEWSETREAVARAERRQKSPAAKPRVLLINGSSRSDQTCPGEMSKSFRLVGADGGNPDPTTTSGKDPQKAKNLEMKGWDYPRHLAGRAFSVVVHGDAAGCETLRRILVDWLKDMGLIGSGHAAELDRYV